MDSSCEKARFAGADLTYADFSRADVSGCDFTGATLFRAKLHRIKDQGALWSNRTLALGDDEELRRAEDFKPVS
jgi:uncharacterized protein YjbI with pentapeptide repeats